MLAVDAWCERTLNCDNHEVLYRSNLMVPVFRLPPVLHCHLSSGKRWLNPTMHTFVLFITGITSTHILICRLDCMYLVSSFCVSTPVLCPLFSQIIGGLSRGSLLCCVLLILLPPNQGWMNEASGGVRPLNLSL